MEALQQAEALSTIPVSSWVDLLLDELTKKYADRNGGGHYRKKWQAGRPWCCDHCQTIHDALTELAQRFGQCVAGENEACETDREN